MNIKEIKEIKSADDLQNAARRLAQEVYTDINTDVDSDAVQRVKYVIDVVRDAIHYYPDDIDGDELLENVFNELCTMVDLYTQDLELWATTPHALRYLIEAASSLEVDISEKTTDPIIMAAQQAQYMDIIRHIDFS